MKGLDGFDTSTSSQQDNKNDHNESTTSKNIKQKTSMFRPGVYNFEPEPPSILNSALKNNPMSGITFFRLCHLLSSKRKSIDWWRYKHRILALFCMSILNSYLSLLEYLYIHIILMMNPHTRSLVRQAKMDHISSYSSYSYSSSKAPVFILGHPRTGTTLLHSLLALDDERFTFCNTFMAGFPHCFLFFETIGKFLFAGILSETRPMDNMKLHFDFIKLTS